MSSDDAATTSQAGVTGHADPHHGPQSFTKLAVGAIGVVFGDIGTSPLYAFKETFIGHHRLPVDQLHIFGVVSLIFWTMTLVVTVKYVAVIMRADNRGEGGSLALLALISRLSPGAGRSRYLILLGVLATALFFGDCIITPAMSVLSAVEGLTVVEASFSPLVLPVAITILVGLFVIQSRGAAKVGALFGPVMVVYFAVLSVLGVVNLVAHPGILQALNPYWAAQFFAGDFLRAFLALGSVVLAVTGAEALYADMGHFGRRPIQFSWLWIVLPALMLNYLGQGALLLGTPAAVENPFLSDGARGDAAAAGDPGDLRHCHRQPGGVVGRVFGDPAGGAARLSAAAAHPAHQRVGGGADLYPAGQLGVAVLVLSCWCLASARRPIWPRPMASP